MIMNTCQNCGTQKENSKITSENIQGFVDLLSGKNPVKTEVSVDKSSILILSLSMIATVVTLYFVMRLINKNM